MDKCFRLAYMFGVVMGYGLIYILNVLFDLICDQQHNSNKALHLENFIIDCCECLKTINIFYIKAIQAASANKDNFSDRLSGYMDNYSDNVPYNEDDFDINNLRNNILGGENITIGNKPVASGTIAVVFKGYNTILKKEYAIKIKRNNIERLIITSIDDMKTFIWLLDKIPAIRHFNLYKTFEENIVNLKEQLNFENEWDNIDKMYQANIRYPDIIIPHAYYRDFTEQYKNIIIMDWIDGMKLNEVPENKKDNFCELVAKFGIKSIFFDGCTHGDLHQGNCRFILDKEIDSETNIETEVAKLAVFDFGILCNIDRVEQDIIYRVFRESFAGNYSAGAKIILDETLTPKHKDSILSPNKYNRLSQEIAHWGESAIGMRKIITPADFQCLSKITEKYGLSLPDWFCKMITSFAINESLSKALSTNKTFIEYATDIIKETDELLG